MLEGNDELPPHPGGSTDTRSRFMLQKSSCMGHWPDTQSLPLYLHDNVYYVFLVIMKFMGDLPMSKHQKETEIVFSLLKVGLNV